MGRVTFPFSVWRGARDFRGFFYCLAAGMVVSIGGSFTSLRAQPVPAKPPATKPPATKATPVVPPADAFNRYGKIWVPSDDPAHPIKLNVQFPGVGDMKIPSQDELNVRDKLEQLAALSDADIHKQLDQWPPFSKMKLGDQGQLLQRIQAFKDLRAKVAMQKAHDMGLLTLLPDQQARFEKEYWDKQLQMERALAKQFEPAWRAAQQKLAGDLYREFSSPSMGPVAQLPKPPPVAPYTATAQTNVAQPIAQAPH
jgi:hypothetical protein